MSEQGPTEHDVRQYERMETQMRHFAEGNLDLCGLIGDLNFLFCALERPDPAWEHEFRRHWGELEIVYAVKLSELEQGRPAVMEDSDRAILNHAIDAIKRLIQQQRGDRQKSPSNSADD